MDATAGKFKSKSKSKSKSRLMLKGRVSIFLYTGGVIFLVLCKSLA